MESAFSKEEVVVCHYPGSPGMESVQIKHQACWSFFPQKHIKEHHEEVRERPCPHPGCNKVFMIDRYLQRHVKLIHTGTYLRLCPARGTNLKKKQAVSRKLAELVLTRSFCVTWMF